MTTRGVNDDLISRIEALEQVVHDLCTQPVMSNSSQRGGTYALYPPTGNTAVEYVGQFNTPSGGSAYGHSFYDQNGSTVLSLSNGSTGLVGVVDHSNWTIPNGISVTSLTWVTLCEHEVVAPVHDMIRFQGAVIVPATTTLQLRLYDSYTASAIGSAMTLTGSYNGSYIGGLIHPWACGWGDTRGRATSGNLQLQAQLTVNTGGAATVYPPRSCQFVSSTEFGGGSSSVPLTHT